ncbi:dienelactone hydrolase family protein [Carboxylicivirga sp. N1Y90]|uniref:dienelactone hydrolase family protein n=1 Tax=Carboxylicivirga fragile TaxID=3417571 RepID=UPI003D341A12|nr:dienelactone hydrolase family protein [Marinilabiliaceae bacterium N1Y90]
MKKISKKDIKQEVFDLYDGYAHNKFSRREFVNKLTTYAVGGITVAGLLNFLMPNYVAAQQIASNDLRLKSEYIEYNSSKGGGVIKGLLTRPANNSAKLPGIIIVHENRGLNPHIEDVARRAALDGFIAFAPDALSPIGGYPGTDDEGRTMQKTRDKNEMLEDFIAAQAFLKDHGESNGKVGVVGFCFGGWISNMMAVRIPDLPAAVPFYGGQPKAEDVPLIKAPLLLHFASLDKRVNTGWPAYEEALKANNKSYKAYMYEDANHGFHNDTTPRYDEAAAKLAWQRTIDFFKEKLS